MVGSRSHDGCFYYEYEWTISRKQAPVNKYDVGEDSEMVKTCVNPACAVPFRYFRGGKLFRFDVKSSFELCLDVPGQMRQLKPAGTSEVFWLCENCCSTMALSFGPRDGIAVVTLRTEQPAGSKSAHKISA